MYNTSVRAHFDYCDIICHTTNLYSQVVTFNYLVERFVKFQYQAALQELDKVVCLYEEHRNISPENTYHDIPCRTTKYKNSF